MVMPTRDPQTGKFVAGSGGSSGGQIHRATAIYMDDGSGDVHEPAYTFQAPDVDRTVVGTMIQAAGDWGLDNEGFQLGELSFDADSAMISFDDSTGSGEVVADDTRSSVLHVGGIRFDEENSTDSGWTGAAYLPQNAQWRRGTELFLHSRANSGNTALRTIVQYVENE